MPAVGGCIEAVDPVIAGQVDNADALVCPPGSGIGVRCWLRSRTGPLDFRVRSTYHQAMESAIKAQAGRSLTPRQRDAMRRLVERHGGGNVRLFGSYARGEAGPSSDVDLLVDMAAGSSLLNLVAISLDIEDELGLAADVVTEAGLSCRMKDQVLREAVSI